MKKEDVFKALLEDLQYKIGATMRSIQCNEESLKRLENETFHLEQKLKALREAEEFLKKQT